MFTLTVCVHRYYAHNSCYFAIYWVCTQSKKLVNYSACGWIQWCWFPGDPHFLIDQFIYWLSSLVQKIRKIRDSMRSFIFSPFPLTRNWVPLIWAVQDLWVSFWEYYSTWGNDIGCKYSLSRIIGHLFKVDTVNVLILFKYLINQFVFS